MVSFFSSTNWKQYSVFFDLHKRNKQKTVHFMNWKKYLRIYYTQMSSLSIAQVCLKENLLCLFIEKELLLKNTKWHTGKIGKTKLNFSSFLIIIDINAIKVSQLDLLQAIFHKFCKCIILNFTVSPFIIHTYLPPPSFTPKKYIYRTFSYSNTNLYDLFTKLYYYAIIIKRIFKDTQYQYHSHSPYGFYGVV